MLKNDMTISGPEKKTQTMSEKVPIPQKMTLSIREAAAYTGIGINKISSLLIQPNCPFVLYVGNKKLVKRKAFEEFLSKAIDI